MAVKKWIFDLNIMQKSRIPRMELVQGDVNANVFQIHLKTIEHNTEKPLNLENSYVTVTVKKADGTVVVGVADIIDSANGIIEYTCRGNELSCPGLALATVEVYDIEKTKRFTTTQFKFNVVEQLDDGSGIPSTTEYLILSDLISKVQSAATNEDVRINNENIRQDNEATRQENENIRQENENQRMANELIREQNEATREAKMAAIESRWEELINTTGADIAEEVIAARTSAAKDKTFPKLGDRIEELESDSLAVLQQVSNLTEQVNNITPEQIGAETPNGAQQKVDAALAVAKDYTDQAISDVSQAINSVSQVFVSHKNDYATLNNLGHVKHAVLTATLDTTWDGDTAPYTKTITVDGILESDVPIIDVVLTGDYETDTAILEAWSCVYRAVTANGSIRFYATEAPAVGFSVQIKVVR